MSSSLEFEFDWESAEVGPPEEQATSATLKVLLGGEVLTRVEDRRAKTVRPAIRVSAYPLAHWLAANWWRLRWEPVRDSVDWALSHELPAVGHGYVWPNVTFSSVNGVIRVSACRTNSSRQGAAADLSPIRYLDDASADVSAEAFEAALDQFITSVVARLKLMGCEDSELEELWEALKAERADPDQAYRRRLEATLGFDMGEAPSERLDQLKKASTAFGREAIAEIAGAVPSEIDWDALQERLRTTRQTEIRDFEDLRAVARQAAQGYLPWQRGESAAKAVRTRMRRENGALSDEDLSSWFGARHEFGNSFAVALRDHPDSDALRISLKSRYDTGQRFEWLRLIGDHLVAANPDDYLLPATNGHTARQKLQRAFAAEMLLPIDDLVKRFRGNAEDEDLIQETADDFGVSPLLVRSRLVNKRLGSGRLLR